MLFLFFLASTDEDAGIVYADIDLGEIKVILNSNGLTGDPHLL